MPCESLQPGSSCPPPPTTCFSSTWRPPTISSSNSISKSNACLCLLPRLPAIYYHIQARGRKMFGELERGYHFREETCWDLYPLTQNVTNKISSIKRILILFQVASRTILPGELVLSESPVVVGPNQVRMCLKNLWSTIYPLPTVFVLTPTHWASKTISAETQSDFTSDQKTLHPANDNSLWLPIIIYYHNISSLF